MSLIKRNNTLFPDFPRFFDDFFGQDLFDSSVLPARNQTIPAVNVKEEDDHFEVELAAPGLNKDDFKVELHNRVLTISSEKQDEHVEEEEGKFSRREFRYSSFSRSFTLPETVDEEGIKASYNDGLLSLNIPKNEKSLPEATRMIEIS